MDVVELAPGLWRWTTAHPDWTPEQGGPEGWEREVGSVYCKAGDDVVLVDPLVPSEDAERERFWQALDRDVAGASTVHVLLTCVWHARSSAEIVDRHGGRLWTPADGREACPVAWRRSTRRSRTRCSSILSSHAALVAGDTLLGDGAGGVRLCPESWLGGRDAAERTGGLRERVSGREVRLRAAHTRRRSRSPKPPRRSTAHLPLDERAGCDNRVVLLREVEYARPESVEEALELLSGNENARALAGGQTLVNVMKQRPATPDLLVDLAELEELHGDHGRLPTASSSSARWPPLGR